ETWVYTGQVYDADGIFSFAENIDDNVLVRIDGVPMLRNTTSNVPTSTGNTSSNPFGGVTNFGMGPNGDGWHNIEIRFGNGTGGAGAVAGTGWTTSFGFGFSATGSTGVNGTADSYATPLDDGTMSLFRTPVSNSLTKLGSGTLTLTGSSVNTYTGL